MRIKKLRRSNRLVHLAVLGCFIGSFTSVSHGEPLAESQKVAGELIGKTRALARIPGGSFSAPQRTVRPDIEPSRENPFKVVGQDMTPPNLYGSVIFMDGKLVGSSIDQVQGGANKATMADTFGKAAAKVISSQRISPAPADNESGRGSDIPEGIFQIEPTTRKMGCRISNTSDSPLKNSETVVVSQISSHVTVLSCVMAPKQPQFTPAADEGPPTVHGCFCYKVCPPRTDARDSCYRVCECFNGPKT